MSIRVSNLRLSLDEPEEALPVHLARALGVKPEVVIDWRILRKSLDARDRAALQFVYTAEVTLPADEDRVVEHSQKNTHPRVSVIPRR